jgi:hypothetical protein
MPDTTTGGLALPFPEPGDALTDYPALAQALAELLEDSIGLVPIEEKILAVAAASATFLAIPQTFEELLLKWSASSSIAAKSDVLRVRFNNDATAGNYLVRGGPTADGNYDRMDAGNLPGSTLTATRTNSRGEGRLWIGSYSEAIRHTLHGQATAMVNDAGAAADLGAHNPHACWPISTALAGLPALAPIVRIDVLCAGGNFPIGSKFQLYGIRSK